jgi:hypothetical protein
MLLATVSMVAFPASAGFNTNFTDPVGDTLPIGAPPQALLDNADVTAGASSANATHIRLDLTTAGNIGYPGALISYNLDTQGPGNSTIISLDGTTLACLFCVYAYDYTGSGGGSGFDMIVPVVTGNTVVVSVPREWGGNELTYLLRFSSTAIGPSGDGAVDGGGQINESPLITNPPGDPVNIPLAPYAYTFTATDPENDPRAWSVDTDAPWLSIDPVTGTLTGTPPGPGSWYVTVTVTDPFSNTDVYSFTLNAAACTGNTAPTISNDVTGAQTIGLSDTYTYDYAATDPQNDALTWSVSGSTFATIDPSTGELDFISPGTAGTHPLTVRVTDVCGNTDTSPLTIIVSTGGTGDTDGDGFPDSTDNCPNAANPTQTDTDGDGIGDACDTGGATADPRTVTAGRTDAITITVTRNQVTWTQTGTTATINYAVDGTTTGTVHHLELVFITEFRSGTPKVFDALGEIPDGPLGGTTVGFHGTGTGGSRATWHSHRVGTFTATAVDPNVSDANFRRLVACYVAYADAAETQWNLACVVVVGEGSGTTGSGDQTGGSGGAAPGSPFNLLLIVIIIVVILFVILGVVLGMRRRRQGQTPPQQVPPPPPPP